LQPRAWELYRSLRERQPVPFGSLIKTGTTTIVSLSPELLFVNQDARIRVRPMKGTAPRGRFTLEDTRIAAALAADAKNRSENIMIVDLLRNDLGKICSIGSVTTKNLFAVERHPTLHQMTSTVEGKLRRGVGLSEIFRALFPSGSVTGAPKLRAMEVLRELEHGTRGVYCGAIGYSSPSGRAVFSVPIRTLHKKPGARSWRYRVGSGIVWDSRAGAEWAECGDKCSFLTSANDDFQLFESILFSKGAFLYLRDHRLRLFDSARYFEFPASLAQWEKTAGEIVAALGGSPGEHKVRVFLDKSGRFSWDHAPLISALRLTQCTAPLNASPAEAAPTPRPVFLSRKPVDPASPFLFHKTTIRPWYSRDMELIARGTCFDVLHTNTEGAITEGARSNVFVQLNGALYTPPLECGLLPGVLRGRLLRSGKCSERILTSRDLRRAEALFCGNSVRGLVEVRFAGVQ
jgi:para-aminobenzoate synthetase / 4-amino-4-deoxychorismate lyase